MHLKLNIRREQVINDGQGRVTELRIGLKGKRNELATYLSKSFWFRIGSEAGEEGFSFDFVFARNQADNRTVVNVVLPGLVHVIEQEAVSYKLSY